MSNPSTSPWTARTDGSVRWDNRMVAQHLPRDLVRPSSGLKELAQMTTKSRYEQMAHRPSWVEQKGKQRSRWVLNQISRYKPRDYSLGIGGSEGLRRTLMTLCCTSRKNWTVLSKFPSLTPLNITMILRTGLTSWDLRVEYHATCCEWPDKDSESKWPLRTRTEGWNRVSLGSR